MHEKKAFSVEQKRRHDAKIICAYAHYVTLGSHCKMASSSSEDKADTWPERPTRIQPQQFEPVRQDSDSTRTSCQQQTCQNWQYGLVIKPFSSPQMIMYWLAFCIVMSRLKCLVWSMFFVVAFSLCRFIKYDWSMTELQWSWISHFSVYHDKIIYYFQGWSNVTKSSASDDLLHVNCNVRNQTQTCFRSTQIVDCLPGVGTSIEGPFTSLLLLLKVCFAYLFIVHFVSSVLQSSFVVFAQEEMLLASNSSLICGIQ